MQDEKTDYALRCRLELELGNLRNLESRYVITPEEALQIMNERIPDMTSDELEKLRMEDKADWIYVNGEVRYIDCFDATLYKVYPEVWNRTKEGDTSNYDLIEDYIHSRTDGESSTAHIHIRHELEIAFKGTERRKSRPRAYADSKRTERNHKLQIDKMLTPTRSRFGRKRCTANRLF